MGCDRMRYDEPCLIIFPQKLISPSGYSLQMSRVYWIYHYSSFRQPLCNRSTGRCFHLFDIESHNYRRAVSVQMNTLHLININCAYGHVRALVHTTLLIHICVEKTMAYSLTAKTAYCLTYGYLYEYHVCVWNIKRIKQMEFAWILILVNILHHLVLALKCCNAFV